MSVTAILRQLGCRTLRIAPFQKKRDADADENEPPDPTLADVDRTHTRQQECNATDQKQRAGDTAMKNAVPKPVGEATDGHGEKAHSRWRRTKGMPIDSNKA